jgi:O-antigen/teichoic acid export membrane protein
MQLMWLVLATVSAQALINLPPIVVKATADAALAGQVLALLAIARIPVFLAPALLAPLLPVMVRQHERHETPRVVRLAAALVGSLFGCASAAALMSLLIGDWLVALLFGSDYGLPPINLAILSAATFIFIAALLVTSALVAVRRNSWALASWVIGLLVFAASAVTVRSVPANVEVGLLAGAATAVLVSGCGLVLTARRGDAVWAR